MDPSQLPELIARANHSLPDADPRKITRSMMADFVRAARTIRLEAGMGTAVSPDETERRALADRLESHARALGSYIRPRTDDATPE